MVYIMLPNLQVVFLLVCPVVERFNKVYMRRFVIGSIVVHRITIISNILKKVANCMEIRVVKGWLT